MFGRYSINGSVEWLGVPDFLRNDGPPWTLNLLPPYASWGDRGSSTNINWGSGSGGHYNSVSILWNRPVHVLPVYHRRIFENMGCDTRRVHEDLLRDNRTYRMQSPSTCRNPIRGRLVNRQDDDWDDLWDNPVDQ